MIKTSLVGYYGVGMQLIVSLNRIRPKCASITFSRNYDDVSSWVPPGRCNKNYLFVL